jgi:hypothetical protein
MTFGWYVIKGDENQRIYEVTKKHHVFP